MSCNTDTPHGYCAPGSSLGISFTNPVKFKDVKRVVSVTPSSGLSWDSWRDDDDLTTFADVSSKFKPGQKYTLTIRGDLKDKYGQKLGKSYVDGIRFDDMWPAVEIGVSGETLEPKTARPISVGSVNVSSYELVTAPLRPADLLKQAGRASDQFAAIGRLAGAKSRTVRPRSAVNVLATEVVDPSAVLSGAHRGPLAIGVRYTGGSNRSEAEQHYVKVIEVTDLAISAKLSRHGSLVWVTRLSDGAPVPNATVELYKKGGGKKSYSADKRGIATIPSSDLALDFYRMAAEDAPVLVARSGDDWAYRLASDYIEAWRYDIPSDLSGRQQRYGMMFTERGIYRPGDGLQVKGIVRGEVPTGNQVPSGVPLELVLQSPEGDEVSRVKLRTSRFGTFSAKLKIPRSGVSRQLAAPRGEVGEGLGHHRVLRGRGVSPCRVQSERRKRQTRIRPRRQGQLDRSR